MGFILKNMLMLSLLWAVLGVTQAVRAEIPIRLVVSIKPLHSLASAVMKGVAEPQLLIQGSASLHHFSLKPSHIRRLQQADVLLWLGATVETSLHKVVAQLPDRIEKLTLLNESSVLRLSMRNGGVWQHDHDHGDELEVGLEGEKIDPHLWLDPLNAVRIALRLSEVLSQKDPVNGDVYQANTVRLIERLQALHGEIEQRLTSIQSLPYLVYHDAYQYFERRYSLSATGAFVLDLGQRAGAKRLRLLRKKIQSDAIRCAFLEPQYDARLLNSVVANLPIKVEVLDPLGADLPAGEALYFDLMRRLTTQLESCLSN